MVRMVSRTLALLMLSGAVAACGQTRVPPAFEDNRAAWLAGCRSGHARGETAYGFTRDAERYPDDQAYREAWDAGYEACVQDVYARRVGDPGGAKAGVAGRGGLPAAKSGAAGGGGGLVGAKGGGPGLGAGGGTAAGH